MFTTLKFLLNCVSQFITKLFSIDLGSISLGLLFCILFILFPILLAIVHFMKTTFVSDMYSDFGSDRRKKRRAR